MNLSKCNALEQLKFSTDSDFNQKLILPENCALTHINLGIHFNQQLNMSNCNKLKELIFGDQFNQILNLNKCVNLNYLKFGINFNQKLNLSKCVNLDKLILGDNFNNGIIEEVISTNKHFDISNLTKLTYLYFNRNILDVNNINLPPDINLSQHINLPPDN